MATSYTTKTAALRATTIDSAIIDTKRLLIKTPEDTNSSRTDIIEYINNYAKKDEANTFTETNTFDNGIISNNDILINGGVLTFSDNIDGTVIDNENSSATGYRYTTIFPVNFNNGVCYDIGELTDNIDLSELTFSAQGRLIQTCELWFTTPATAPTNHQWPANTYWIDSATGTAPTLLPSKNYRIVFRQEPKKIIASIAYMY